MPDRKLEKDYPVNGGPGPILLTIVIGDGQIGASKVFLDQTLIAKGAVQHLPVGVPDTLRGHSLSIRTNVLDANPQTKHTSVTYILTGGAVVANDTLTFDAPHDGDVVPYVAIYTLV